MDADGGKAVVSNLRVTLFNRTSEICKGVGKSISLDHVRQADSHVLKFTEAENRDGDRSQMVGARGGCAVHDGISFASMLVVLRLVRGVHSAPA